MNLLSYLYIGQILRKYSCCVHDQMANRAILSLDKSPASLYSEEALCQLKGGNRASAANLKHILPRMEPWGYCCCLGKTALPFSLTQHTSLRLFPVPGCSCAPCPKQGGFYNSAPLNFLDSDLKT